LQSAKIAGRLPEELPACAQPTYAYTDLMNVVYAVIVTGLHAIHTGQESTVADDLVHAAVSAFQIGGANADVCGKHGLARTHGCSEPANVFGTKSWQFGGRSSLVGKLGYTGRLILTDGGKPCQGVAAGRLAAQL